MEADFPYADVPEARLKVLAIAGAETRMGPAVVLAIDGVDVIVTSNRVQALEAGLFLLPGVNRSRNRVLVLESSIHFRGAFEPLASRVIEVDTPSLSSPASRATRTGTSAARYSRWTLLGGCSSTNRRLNERRFGAVFPSARDKHDTGTG